MRLPRYYYITASLALLIVEIVIEGFVNDRFIRPYLGDFLVVILLYTTIMSVSFKKPFPVAIAVLAFSYFIEMAQYFNLIRLLHLQEYRWAKAVLGTSFSWWDLVMYSAGIVSVLTAERFLNKPQATQ